MADKKITELTNITGANLVDADEFVVVDISADETKAITLGELKEAFDSGSGFVRITGDTMTGDLTVPNVIVSGNVDGRDVSVDGTKLDGIEASADVTDATNVAAAGAAMETGADFTGDVTFGDNDKAIFGAGSDLQIYSDGNSAIIKELSSTGSLYVQADQLVVQNAAATENKAIFATDGAVTLYHDNASKLATTITGIDVTGTVTADGLTVDGGSNLRSTSNSTLTFTGYSGSQNVTGTVNVGRALTTGTSSFMYLQTNDGTSLKTRQRIDSNGDISFYEDTGTTPKFFWDASAESLGIGTSSPDYQIDIEASSPSARLNSTVNNGVNTIWFGHSDDADAGAIRYWGSAAGLGTYANSMTFNTNGSQVMHLDSSGKVGIGTSSPSYNLHVEASSASVAVISGTSGNSTILLGDTADNNKGRIIYTNSIDTMKVLTNGTEAMRIDSSGNVGIGTSSPSVPLHISKADDARLRLTDTGDVCTFTIRSDGPNTSIGTDTAHPVRFMTNNTERMRIDSSGNVGIGTDSPTTALTVSTDGTEQLTINRADASINTGNTVGTILFTGDDPSANQTGARIQVLAAENWTTNAYGSHITFSSDSNGTLTERMRIDASGNLLVGGTSAYGTSTFTVGFDGDIKASSSSRSAIFNSTTSGYSGSLVDFRVADIKVGGIGTANGYMELGSSDTGIRFYTPSDAVIPANPSTNSARDAAIDLGISSQRFKDLYLSGGVYLGGTGSANKLDDYETGTWTPTYSFSGGGTVTTTTNTGKYVKIGSLVQASFKIRSSGVSGVSGNLQINGLPFTISSEERSGGSPSFMRNWAVDMPNFRFAPVQGTTYIVMYWNATNSGTAQVDTTEFSTGSDNNVLEAHVIYQV